MSQIEILMLITGGAGMYATVESYKNNNRALSVLGIGWIVLSLVTALSSTWL